MVELQHKPKYKKNWQDPWLLASGGEKWPYTSTISNLQSYICCGASNWKFGSYSLHHFHFKRRLWAEVGDLCWTSWHWSNANAGPFSIKLKMKFSLTDLIEWIDNQQFDGEKGEQTKRIQRRLDGALCLKDAKESPGRPFVYCKFITADHYFFFFVDWLDH